MTANMLSESPDFLKSCDEEAWEGLIRYLLDKVGDYFGYQVTTESLENSCAGDGFCVDILHAAPTQNAPIHWKGILGASIVDDRLRVSLLVFVFSGNERLVTTSGCQFAEYVYEVDKVSGGCWKLQGWFKDEYGEYDHFLADEAS